MRSTAEEYNYNKRWMMGLLGGLLLLSVMAAVWMLAMAPRLPEQLATHWNSHNEVDGWSSLWGAVLTLVLTTLGVGGVICAIAIVARGQNTLLARVGAGLGVGLGIGVGALMVAVVAGQIDLVDTSNAEISGPVMAAGLATAALLGTGVMWLYRPGDIDRTQSAEAVAAATDAVGADSALGVVAQQRASRGETLQIKTSMGPWMWAWSLGLGAIVALSVYFIFPWLALLGVVVAALTWVFTSGIVVIGPEGVKVLAGGFAKIMPLRYDEIRRATVEDIKAMDYGGWGYRMNGGSIGFIMSSGPAIVMEAGFHQKYVISMPTTQTAGEAAALVNAYVQAQKVKK